MTTTKRIADLSLRKQLRKPKIGKVVSCYFISLIAEILFYFELHTKLAQTIPVHWSFSGSVNQTIRVSWRSFLTIPFLQTCVLGIFLLVVYSIGHAKIQLVAGEPQASAYQTMRQRHFDTLLLERTFFYLQILLAFLNGALFLQNRFFLGITVLFLVLLSLYIVISIIFQKHKQERSGNFSDERFDEQPVGWKSNYLYSNPDDASVIVEKRQGYGYTLNFGQPIAWVASGASILLVVVLVIGTFFLLN